MERKTKIIIGIVLGVAVIGTGVGIYFYNKNKKGGDNSGDETSGGDKGTATGGSLTSDETTSKDKEQSSSVVKVGSKGLKVGFYQAFLNYKFNAGIPVDGRYGTVMRDAVRKYLKLTCNKLVPNDDCNLATADINKQLAVVAKDPKFMAYYKPIHKKLMETFK